MKTLFSRWLPTIAGNGRREWFTAVAHAPVPRRAVLAATGLTTAAALAGGPASEVATGTAATSAPRPVGFTAPLAGPPEGASARLGAAERQDVPPEERLIPYGTQGPQSRAPLSEAQRDNARTIVEVARRTGMGERAAVIAVATALQESKLLNLGHLGSRNDHDSLGLFQQRPSTGWGSPEQVTDPEYASEAFYAGLRRVDGWQRMPLTDAAQTVQVSAYPFAYAQWERQAAEVVREVWDD